MELSPNDQLHGFTVLTREELPEIDGTAYVPVSYTHLTLPTKA